MFDLIKFKILGLADFSWLVAFMPVIIWAVVLGIIIVYCLIKYRDLL
jgi:hypothetical protein